MEFNRLFRSLTTFKIGGPARAFTEIKTSSELPEALSYAEREGLEVLILGGGSNMLVSDSGFDGCVIQVGIRGIEEIDGSDTTRLLRIGSGEVWDDVVRYAVDHGLWGIENLSRIPGRSGAFTVQNVGAYGPEAKDVVVAVDVYDRKLGKFATLDRDECHFSYRKSIFNTTEKNRYVILSTLIRLSLLPVRNLDYPDVRRWFEGNPAPSQQQIREAIKQIRDKKFPFPAESVEGNAGSFFKNSILTEEQYKILEQHFASNFPASLQKLQDIRHKFPSDEGIKIPSAFILDVCGLKGFTLGKVSLNPSQPVVVLNTTGDATAAEVLQLVQAVRAQVRSQTSLHLYTEPELIGFTESELRGYDFNDQEIQRYIYGAVE